MDRAGGRTESDRVPAVPKAPAEIRLLEVHPESLVEAADGVERLGADHHHRPGDRVDERVAREIPVFVIEAFDPPIARRQRVEPDDLGERQPERRKALGRRLWRPVRVRERRAHQTAGPVHVEEAPERHEALGFEHDVRVHRADMRRSLRGRGAVDSRAIAGIVRVLEHRDLRVGGPHRRDRAVGRAVVGHDDARIEPGGRLAGRRDGLERELPRVVADDDHRGVLHIFAVALTVAPSSARWSRLGPRRGPGSDRGASAPPVARARSRGTPRSVAALPPNRRGHTLPCRASCACRR